jgi:hypothetical protein
LVPFKDATVGECKDPVLEIQQSNEARAREDDRLKQAADERDVSLDRRVQRESAWFRLRLVIKNPANPEQLTDDRAALAEAFEELAATLRESEWHEHVKRAHVQAKENLRLSQVDSRKEGSAGKDSRAEYDILTVLEATIKKPGTAATLTPHLTMAGFPGNHVIECESLVSVQISSRKRRQEINGKEYRADQTFETTKLPVVNQSLNQIRYQGECYDVSADAALLFQKIVDNHPQPISASRINRKPSRLKDSLPAELKQLIVAESGKGYRLSIT